MRCFHWINMTIKGSYMTGTYPNIYIPFILDKNNLLLFFSPLIVVIAYNKIKSQEWFSHFHTLYHIDQLRRIKIYPINKFFWLSLSLCVCVCWWVGFHKQSFLPLCLSCFLFILICQHLEIFFCAHKNIYCRKQNPLHKQYNNM